VVVIILNITIEKLQASDAENLLEFERKNRAFFEKLVPSRGEDYFILENFNKRHQDLLDEQTKGLSFFSLIKNLDGLILGRMNLVDIDMVQGLGHIGYRIGEEHAGKGITSNALGLFLDMMDKHGINKIVAKTTTLNIASQKVLEKNGFKYVDTDEEAFMMNGQKQRFVEFVWEK
jgi:[ribosomal protein S5]-alanine N-acetyltransferase